MAEPEVIAPSDATRAPASDQPSVGCVERFDARSPNAMPRSNKDNFVCVPRSRADIPLRGQFRKRCDVVNKALCVWSIGLCALLGSALLVRPVTAGDSSSGSIGDRVWHDLDGDGIQDPGEPGIPGVALTLLPFDSGNTGIFDVVTDAEGRYFFDNLPVNAAYRVVVDAENFNPGGPLAGLAPTLSFIGDPTHDSDGGHPVARLSDNTITATEDLDLGFGPCSTCVGGATALSIKYVGSLNGAQVQASASGLQLASAVMNPGEIINVTGPGGGLIGNLLTMTVNGQPNAVFDTSCACCSTPLPYYNPSNGVSTSTIASLLQQIGASVSAGSGFDLNGDGRITGIDLNILLDPTSGPTSFDPPRLTDTTLVEERFESTPIGWEANGLWHFTSACRRDPVCDGNQWAYFGSDNRCNYATNGFREQGFLTSPPIMLPEASGCGALKLSYCHFLQTTNSNQANKARVLCNGQVIDTITPQSPLKWRTRTLDLTAFAGQTVRLQWEFNTTATTLHNKLGWQVDNIRIVRSEGGSLCIGTGIRVGDFEIFSGRSSAGLLCEHSICCEDEVDPAGACCLPDGTCQVFPSGPECIAAGGAFYGEGTSCDDANCQSRLGACCKQSYDSAGNSFSTCTQTSLATCIQTGGTFLGIGVQCSNTACTFAACCIQDIGLCTVIPPAQCESLGGTPGPLNSDCGDIQCTPKGACCLYNGHCRQETRVDCHNNYGVYKGDYTRCTNVSCPPTGACCYNANGGSNNSNSSGGSSCTVVAEWYCVGVLHGRYQGDHSACTDQTCTPTGACCVVLGHCIPNKTSEQCRHLLGIWRGAGSSCSNARCDDRGACCLDPGGCVPLVTEAACVHVLKGTWAGRNVSCGNANCTPIGACCLPNGGCEITTRTQCNELDGVYRGDNSLCITANCSRQRACCLPGGGCEVTTEANCVNVIGGIWRFNKFNCNNPECPPPAKGRCCVRNFSNGQIDCINNISQSDCANRNGIFGGPGSTCATSPCPPVGRCCFAGSPGAGSTCENFLTQAECEGSGGQWGGPGSTCTSTPCLAPTGACCFTNGTQCTVVTSAACAQLAGRFAGADTNCNDCPCSPNTPGNQDRGACCFIPGNSNMVQCVETDFNGCNNNFGIFSIDKCCEDVVCDAQAFGRCCLIDFTNGDPGPLTCITTTESRCQTLGGLFGGRGTNCQGNACIPN